jgi:hypothetical protein
MESKSNTPKAPDFASHPYHKIVLPTVQIFLFLTQITLFYYQKTHRSKIPDRCLKMVQSSSYWEALWLELPPPVTWHWFGPFKE